MKDNSAELFALVNQLENGSEDALAELDKYGLFAAAGEDCRQCACRIKKWLEANNTLVRELKSGRTVEIDPGINVSKKDLIPDDFTCEADKKTNELYGFSLSWVPGFFLNSGVGPLWGGCAWHDDTSERTLFALRGSFRKKNTYLVYDRNELIAHESCHAARSPLGNDWQLEECILNLNFSGEAFVFLMPAFLLLLQQLLRMLYLPDFPGWPAWIILVAAISYLLGRNHFARSRYFKAEKNIITFTGCGQKEAGAVLFRSSWQDIKQIAACRNAEQLEKYLRQEIRGNLRLKTALRRFIPGILPEEGK